MKEFAGGNVSTGFYMKFMASSLDPVPQYKLPQKLVKCLLTKIKSNKLLALLDF